MIEALKLSVSCKVCQSILDLSVCRTVAGYFLGTMCKRCSPDGVINTMDSKFYETSLATAAAYDLLVGSDLTILNEDPELTDLHAKWSMQIIAYRAVKSRTPGTTKFEQGFQALLKDDDDAGAAKLLYGHMAEPEHRKQHALYLLKECLTMARIAGALNERNGEERRVV